MFFTALFFATAWDIRLPDLEGDNPKRQKFKRYHHDTHIQLRSHLSDIRKACFYARHRQTLSGLMPYEYSNKH